MGITVLKFLNFVLKSLFCPLISLLGQGHRFWPFSYKKTQTHSLSVTDFGDLTDVTLAALGDSTVLVDDLARAMLISFSKG